jgi:hypothetical protein
MGESEEVDFGDVLNPLKQPGSRRSLAMAGITVPVLLDRLGGYVTWTDDEWEALNARYDGAATFQLTRTKDGRWEARLVKGKPKAQGRLS